MGSESSASPCSDSDKKAHINAIWEKLNAKSNSPNARHVPKIIESKCEPKERTQPNSHEWMTSLGFQKRPTVTKPAPDLKPSIEKHDIEDAKRIAESALAAAKQATSISKIGKIEVNEVRDFAGEEVKITRLLDPNSKAAQELKRKQEMVSFSSSSLDKLLHQIDKKPKLNVLEKSRKDWTDFKEEKQIKEELEMYQKSGHKYTDKVAFLQRSELREYEQERDARLAKKKQSGDILSTED